FMRFRISGDESDALAEVAFPQQNPQYRFPRPFVCRKRTGRCSLAARSFASFKVVAQSSENHARSLAPGRRARYLSMVLCTSRLAASALFSGGSSAGAASWPKPATQHTVEQTSSAIFSLILAMKLSLPFKRVRDS